MSGEAPDLREQEDCLSGKACDWSCDQHGCLHPGTHSAPNNCPDCGRFSGHSWATQPYYGPNGFDQSWGGTCKSCGEWSESVA